MMGFYNLSEFNKESDGECSLDTSKDNIPVFRVVFDQHDPNQGVKSIELTDKPIHKFKIMETKQSGYQKLKAELEAANKKIKELEETLKALNEQHKASDLKDQAERV